MPWRDRPTRYRVWISEIMLQQTQVATVIPYFTRFVQRFPNVRRLAAADPAALLQSWEGLGYYTRVRNLHKAARHVIDNRAGRLPACFAEWLALPGVGRYTAAAIASIADGEAVPAVDGNVLRVFARFWGCDDDVALAGTRDRFFARLQPLLATAPPSQFNQAVMEVGALLCRPRRPSCDRCPLAGDCVAQRDGLTAALPVKSRAARGPRHEVGVAFVQRRNRTLLTQRPAERLLGSLWELPGMRREGRESLRATAHRAAASVCRPTDAGSATARPGRATARDRELLRLTHSFSHFSETMHVFAVAPRPGARAAPGAGWFTPAEVAALPCTTAARKILAGVAHAPHHRRSA